MPNLGNLLKLSPEYYEEFDDFAKDDIQASFGPQSVSDLCNCISSEIRGLYFLDGFLKHTSTHFKSSVMIFKNVFTNCVYKYCAVL